MKLDFLKAIQVLNFFARKEKKFKLDKVKALKLVWLADKAHLVRNGRPIIGDEYFAMKNGPVASAIYNIYQDIVPNRNYADQFLMLIDKNNIKSLNEVDFDEFSKSDLIVLEDIYNNFGHLNNWELSNLTHKFYEWNKHESSIQKGSKRERMDYLDFFKSLNHSYFNDIDQDWINASLETFQYYYAK